MNDTATVPDGAAVADSTKPPPQRLIAVLVTVGSLLVVSLLVLTTSRAAFTGQTDNSANSWSTSSVALSDDDAGDAMFTVTGMVPGDTVSESITVTNDSTAASVDVRLFGEDLTDTTDVVLGESLAEYLDLTIEAVGGTVPVYDGTLADFAATWTDSEASLDGWDDVVPDATRDYEFTVTLSEATPNEFQVASAGIRFVWEATSNPTPPAP